MYSYSKRAKIINFTFVSLLIFMGIFVKVDIWYKVAMALVSIMLLRDAIKELNASFELQGDRMVVRSKDKIVREILYKEMKYLTITRKNKKWIVIADDQKILFTIKPKIDNHEKMVAELISLNKSNKKMIVHDYIKKTYKK